MADSETKFEVTYVGPFAEGVEEGDRDVLPGETIEVDEARAAHLTAGDAWKLAHPRGKKPTPAPPGDEASSLTPSPFDVHENPPETEEPASGEPEPAPTEET